MRLDRGAARDVLTAKIDMGGYYAQTRRDGHRGAGFRAGRRLRGNAQRPRDSHRRRRSASRCARWSTLQSTSGTEWAAFSAERSWLRSSTIRPEAFDAKGDNIAAVIYVNDVDCDRFREIDQIGGER